MSVDAVAPLGGERLRRLPAGLRRARRCRPARARPRASRRRLDAARRLAPDRCASRCRRSTAWSAENVTTWLASVCRQRREARAVEVDPVVVDEVRILARIHAARAEPDLPRRFVDAAATARTGQAPLVIWFFTAPVRAVVEIEVVPAVALGHPEHFPARPANVEAVLRCRSSRRTSSPLPRPRRAPRRSPRRPR